MSSSSTGVSTSEDQAQPTETESRLRECIALAEALDAQLEAASRRDGARVPVHLANEGAAAANAKRHSRKCQICRHRDRDLIEADFLEWSHPSQICEDYKISYRALYRHATATGLLERRRENVCIVVHKLLEEVEYVENPSAFAILRAVRTLASLDSRGRWSEPRTTHVVVNTTDRPAESPNPITETLNASTAEPAGQTRHSPLVTSHRLSNRHTYEKLELPATRTKQTSEATSNRHKTRLRPR